MKPATAPRTAIRPGLALWASLLLLGPTPGLPAPDDTLTEPLERLTETARRFLAERAGTPNGSEIRIRVTPPDSRLRLTRCDRPPEAQLAPGARPIGGTTVNLRCAEPVQWSIFIPARVECHVPVVVAARPLARQQTIGSEDVRLERRDVATLAGGYLDTIAAAVGLYAKRSLTPGQVLTGTQLAPPQIVRLGQTVTLIAATGGIQIRMSGEAMDPGTVGQRIRVRNLSSRRIVEGEIQPAGTVQVAF